MIYKRAIQISVLALLILLVGYFVYVGFFVEIESNHTPIYFSMLRLVIKANKNYHQETGRYAPSVDALYEKKCISISIRNIIKTDGISGFKYHYQNKKNGYECYCNPAGEQPYRTRSYYVNQTGIIRFRENEERIQYRSGGDKWEKYPRYQEDE